jgi:hypothetical protein
MINCINNDGSMWQLTEGRIWCILDDETLKLWDFWLGRMD